MLNRIIQLEILFARQTSVLDLIVRTNDEVRNTLKIQKENTDILVRRINLLEEEINRLKRNVETDLR